MDECLTRGVIWLAMGAWTVGMVTSGRAVARVWWLLGMVAYVAHILLAYGFFYEWSHRVAWEETARETSEAVGLDSGLGLVVNFAFAAILGLDLLLQWSRGVRLPGRWLDGVVVFLIINGAIVFGEGAVRWYGAALVLVIGAFEWKRISRARSPESRHTSVEP
jgi:hypothetical protein